MLVRGWCPRNREQISLLSMSPISLAAYYNQYDITQYIIDKIKDINIREEGNWTPLMWASMGQNIEIVRLLLKRGALVELKNDKGSTAIGLVAVQLDINIELLVLLCSFVKDYENCDNFTKFLVSAFRGDLNAIRNILNSNVDKKFLSREESPALLLAAHGGHRETLSLLISYGARISDRHRGNLQMRLLQIIDQVQNETTEKFTI